MLAVRRRRCAFSSALVRAYANCVGKAHNLTEEPNADTQLHHLHQHRTSTAQYHRI